MVLLGLRQDCELIALFHFGRNETRWVGSKTSRISLLNREILTVNIGMEGLPYFVQSSHTSSAEACSNSSDAGSCLVLPDLEEVCTRRTEPHTYLTRHRSGAGELLKHLEKQADSHRRHLLDHYPSMVFNGTNSSSAAAFYFEYFELKKTNASYQTIPCILQFPMNLDSVFSSNISSSPRRPVSFTVPSTDSYRTRVGTPGMFHLVR